ncbi:uncharacterized protein LOC142347892 isoform X2 [Convolutriloba macropyga]
MNLAVSTKKFSSIFYIICAILIMLLDLNTGPINKLWTPKQYVYSLHNLVTNKSHQPTWGNSGKPFQGLKIRSFPNHKKLFLEDSSSMNKMREKIPTFNRPKWAHQRPECTKWSVATSFGRQMSDSVRIQMTLPPEWCMVIVADRKLPQKHPLNEGKKGRVIYLSLKDQDQLALEGVILSKSLPRSHFGRKNLGYLYAIVSGAQLIWDFDNNNTLLTNPAKIIEPVQIDKSEELRTVLRARSINNKSCDSFNPFPFMGAGQLQSWPRGIPLVDREAKECQRDAYKVEELKTVPERKIAVYQSLANHHPDVDAIYRGRTQTLPFDFASQSQKPTLIVVPEDSFAPFNSQATLFTYEAFFMLFLPVTVQERVSDIWRSYLGQKVLKDIGYQIAFTNPQVVQHRNEHTILADLDSERDLYLKSGKLVEFLKYNFTSNCSYSLECHFESVVIALYEHNYLQLNDVYLFQLWIRSLVNYGYKFPREPLLSTKKWPDLMLFAPVHPNGGVELNNLLLRSLKLFWPKNNLKLLFLVDGDEPVGRRDTFVKRLQQSMANYTKSIEVKFNFIPKEVYLSRGHDRQQLIMLWADNFTNADYIGFIDDDTLFTNHVLLEDIFDEKGRPHVWGRSNKDHVVTPYWPIGTHNWEIYWGEVEETSRWTDNSSMEVMRTMNYFPVVVKTCHLKVVRDNILKHHPQFKYFDDFFKRGIREKKRSYSQFNIMHQHLWKLKKDEYNWHLEGTSAKDDHFKLVGGVTDEMTFPKPRCSLHYNYDIRKFRVPKFDEDVLKRGFCYSLTKWDFDGEYGRVCEKAGYGWAVVSTIPNTDQWKFEELDWRWDNRTVEAHKKRFAINRIRLDWNEQELEKLFKTTFGSINAKNVRKNSS